jgi:hypothetical protein
MVYQVSGKRTINGYDVTGPGQFRLVVSLDLANLSKNHLPGFCQFRLFLSGIWPITVCHLSDFCQFRLVLNWDLANYGKSFSGI